MSLSSRILQRSPRISRAELRAAQRHVKRSTASCFAGFLIGIGVSFLSLSIRELQNHYSSRSTRVKISRENANASQRADRALLCPSVRVCQSEALVPPLPTMLALGSSQCVRTSSVDLYEYA